MPVEPQLLNRNWSDPRADRGLGWEPTSGNARRHPGRARLVSTGRPRSGPWQGQGRQPTIKPLGPHAPGSCVDRALPGRLPGGHWHPHLTHGYKFPHSRCKLPGSRRQICCPLAGPDRAEAHGVPGADKHKGCSPLSPARPPPLSVRMRPAPPTQQEQAWTRAPTSTLGAGASGGRASSCHLSGLGCSAGRPHGTPAVPWD